MTKRVPPFHLGIGLGKLLAGGMAKWTIATVLKTVGRKPRGFESLSLREKASMPFLSLVPGSKYICRLGLSLWVGRSEGKMGIERIWESRFWMGGDSVASSV